MSRCTSPCLWAWCSASATVATSSTASCSDRRDCLSSCGEVGAVDVLRDDEAGELLGAADIIDGHDVRVIEVGDGAGFGQVGFGIFGRERPARRCGTLIATSRCNCSSWAR